ncbi:hypothetical protein GCM10007304_04620 [Rhodococcoides trifolii]|uniref:Uncharacterized protein n=1 Tax=Rhodococcoides trifolii TaxID=908250 RepID=A0A917FN58_9NOCA|nr:hypothetical protein [Rhodococcus trifolii]GGF93900.1 hypothetical protein GCM10007304_04620 [Rhodococcus trifolii]
MDVFEIDITDATRAVVDAGALEAGRHADELVGTGPLPGTPAWDAEQGTDIPAQRQLAWHLLSLRIQRAAGLDGIETVVVLRVQGATWSAIGRATGMTRQSAHERWGARAAAVLDPMGTGQPEIVARDEPTR